MARSEGIEGARQDSRWLLAGEVLATLRRSLRSYLVVVTGILMLVNLYLIFMVAPTDAILGHVQRVFYFHVPMAILSFVAFLVVFLASATYVFRRDSRWDNLAYAAAEVGVVLISLALITGVIWAKPVWNAWWLWTPRLTTTLILWLIYVAYMMIRAYAPNQTKAAIYGAIMGMIGFIDVLVVYFSVQWWPGIHPTPVVGPLSESGSLDGTMRGVLGFSFLTFAFLLLYLVVERMSLRSSEDRIKSLRFLLRRSQVSVDPGD